MTVNTHRHNITALLFSRAGWGLIAAVLSRLLVLVSAILVSRTLGKESLGILSLLQTTVLLVGGFVGIGFGMAATRILSDEETLDSDRAGGAIRLLSATTFMLLIAAAAALTFASHFIAEVLIGAPTVQPFLAIAGLLLVFNGYQLYQTGLLAGLGEFRAAAIANAMSTVVALPLLFYAASLKDLAAIIWALTLAAFFACIITSRAIHLHCRAQGIHRSWTRAWSERSLLTRYGLLCLLLGLVYPAVDWISFRLMIAPADGLGELGVYSAANFWCMLVLFIPVNISSAVLKTACSAKRSDESKVLFLSFGTAGTISLLVCLVLGLASPWIMLTYGQEFHDRWPVLLLLLAAGVFLSLQVTAEQLGVAQDRIWTTVLLKIVVGMGFCAGIVILRPYGAEGAAFARLASSIFGAAAFMFLVLRARKRIATEISDRGTRSAANLSVAMAPVAASPK